MGKTPIARAVVNGQAHRRRTKSAATAATDRSAADGSVGDWRICTVPNTNDWYLTTDNGIPLGPYGSRKEAETILALLRRQAGTSPGGQ